MFTVSVRDASTESGTGHQVQCIVLAQFSRAVYMYSSRRYSPQEKQAVLAGADLTEP